MRLQLSGPLSSQPVGIYGALTKMADPEENISAVGKRLGLPNLSQSELLMAFAAVVSELGERGISRTKNNPVADYAEWLVASRMELDLSANSRLGFDAIGNDGAKYQIKSRRLTEDNRSTQLGVIRNLDSRPFDFLIAVIFEADFSVLHAARIPVEVVREISRYSEHQNGHILHVRPAIFKDTRVVDVARLLDA